CSQGIVICNFSGVYLSSQVELMEKIVIGNVLPVDGRISHMMGDEVTCGSTELGFCRTMCQHLQLIGEPVVKYHHLLTKLCRGCRLSMRTGQHRDISPLPGQRLDLCNHFLKVRDISLLQRLLPHHRCGGILDIL